MINTKILRRDDKDHMGIVYNVMREDMTISTCSDINACYNEQDKSSGRRSIYPIMSYSLQLKMIEEDNNPMGEKTNQGTKGDTVNEGVITSIFYALMIL